MQPSEYEIQREVEALRDIRRRSTVPGALTIDPDLPNQSSSPSPSGTYWSTTNTPSLLEEEDESSSSHGDDSSHSSHAPSNPADDPFHLFWVPADVHPEIAPAEFRAFLQEHSRNPAPDGSASPQRSNSLASVNSSLGRKKSMLSRQYRPSENDGVENEDASVRRRSSVRSNLGPQLTINDLQRLEELAEEASESDDFSKLRNVVRRSLSLNISPSAIDKMDIMPDMDDEADSPIIVPPPGQIVRRANRTKIRKPGLSGDGGGHRFGAARRITRPQPTLKDQRSSSDLSSSDHGDSAEPSISKRSRTFSNESSEGGHSDEALSIFDAYTRDDETDSQHSPGLVTIPSSATAPAESPKIRPPPAAVEPPRVVPSEPSTVIHQPQPQRLLTPQAQGLYRSRTPSPSEDGSPSSSLLTPTRSPEPPSFSSSSQAQRKDKDKKGGLFSKWGSDKGGKKNGKERDRERERAEDEKGTGFFGSLFGSKKKQEDLSVPLGLGAASGREAAAALLGASKSSRSYQPSPSPTNVGAANNYARYPIHVERAIYRLSHIKLANPRRPLYEQVLISNLMFWYLGVINKTTPAAGSGAVPPSPVKESTAGEGNKPNGNAASVGANAGQEQREREEREKAEKEKQEKEQREAEQKKKESTRRGTLNKANQPGNNARRAAEMPVRGPQYEMQHRVMEQEYGVGYGQQPGSGGGGGGQHGRLKLVPPQQVIPPNLLPLSPQQQHQQQHNDPYQPGVESYYYTESGQLGVSTSPLSPKLPAGAMAPPMNVRSPTGMNSGQQAGFPLVLGPGSQRSRSPPGQSPVNFLNSPQSPKNSNAIDLVPNRFYQHPPQQPLDTITQPQPQSGRPNRSLSAMAAASPPPPSVNGGGAKLRKGVSVHAYAPSPPNGIVRPRTAEGPVSQRKSEDVEDVPLAVWQRQRR